MRNIFLQREKLCFLYLLHSVSTLFTALAIMIIITSLTVPALAQQGSLGVEDFFRINEDGFGDAHNSYAWSMEWFKGKLYVGVNRDWMCLNMAIFGVPPEESQLPVECAPSVYDLDLRAEIWCYTPETSVWERVYKSPTVEIPDSEGEPVSFARDAGYRTMRVFEEPNGEEALYIITYTPQSVPNTPAPILLRTTDGINFENLGSPGSQYLESFEISTYRGIEVYKGKMYISFVSNQGWGTVLVSENPASGIFELASLPPLGGNANNIFPFEMAVYDDYLWIGTFNPEEGYEVLKTDGTGTPYITFTPVVTNGAYRGPENESVVSLYPFKGDLYVGSGITMGGNDVFFDVGPAPAELIRIHTDDTWELICGSERDTPDGYKIPLSSMQAGFNNICTGYIWRMEEHNGWLYLGTMDNSYFVQFQVPEEEIPPDTPTWIVKLFQRITYKEAHLWGGYDLWKTQNGVDWYLITANAMGKDAENYEFNYGARSFKSTPYGLFLGTAEPYYGCEVWLGQIQQHSPEPPANLSANLIDKNKVKLTWTHTSPENIALFRVLRRGFSSNSPAKKIGITDENFFVDNKTARDSGYCYEVEAYDVQGNFSYASNMVYAETIMQDDIKPLDNKSKKTKSVLLQNHPNPFNPETWIPYRLASPEFVEINIYDLQGQLVRTLPIGLKPAGEYLLKNEAAHWDGKDNLGQEVASGVYFYTIKAGKFKATRQMVIIK